MITGIAEMKEHSQLARLLASRALVWTALACPFAPMAAHAQQVALIVNGLPITTYDIAQRQKLIVMTTRKSPSRQEVIDDLINDKLKLTIAKRYRLDIEDKEVDTAYSEMARRMRQSSDQLTKILSAQGVDAYTLKDRIRAEIGWQQIVRGKFSASLTVNEKDIVTALESRGKDDKQTVGTEYRLRPILFVMRKGAGEDTLEARKRDAEALRARFENCESGISFARGLRDVAVRDQIIRTSADIPQALREILDKTPIGHLTEPEVTQQGIEMFALCNRQDTRLDSAAKREIQNEMVSKKFLEQSDRFLKELRKQAMIEYKEGADAKTAGDNDR
jgi:peptidyl-prolyl cis-trans isomerase SurA